jgi:hypothetical protein
METIIILAIFLTTIAVSMIENKYFQSRRVILPTVYNHCRTTGEPPFKRMRMSRIDVDV